MNDYTCEVIKSERLAGRIMWLTVRCPEIAREAAPGNAVMVFASAGLEPLLGRPFAVADADRENGLISVCYMLCGRGTKLMSEFTEGERVRVRGVFGVPLPRREKRVYIAAGGVGAAMFLSFKKNFPDMYAGLYLGVPGRGYERFAEKVRSLVPDVRIYADDGSFGCGDSMFKALPKPLGCDEEVWSCGPPGFLTALEKYYAEQLDKLYFSLDNRMACGYGGCMGCTIETRNGLKRLCVDKSLFRADEVIRDEH